MNTAFYLTCFGILGCYAALRTVRAGWIKVVIVILLVGCITHLLIKSIFDAHPGGPVTQTVAVQAGPMETGSSANPSIRAEGGIGGFVHRRIEALQTDRCLLAVLRETPVGPFVYMWQMHEFLDGYKRMQTAQMAGSANLGNVSKLLVQSFGDTAPRLTPEEVSAVQREETNQSVCDAFGKWAGRIAQLSPQQQREVWDQMRNTTASTAP